MLASYAHFVVPAPSFPVPSSLFSEASLAFLRTIPAFLDIIVFLREIIDSNGYRFRLRGFANLHRNPSRMWIISNEVPAAIGTFTASCPFSSFA